MKPYVLVTLNLILSGKELFNLAKKRKSGNSGIIFAIIIIIAVLVCFLFLSSPGNLTENKTVRIEEGTSTVEIASILKDNGVISSELVFLIKVNMSDFKGRLRFGTFEFTPDDTYNDIIRKLALNGEKRETVTVTIPEGYSVEKIITRLINSGLSNEKDLKAALNDKYDFDFLKKIDFPDSCIYELEGFLFPSTYEFYTDNTAHEIFEIMLSEFQKQYDSMSSSYSDIYEIITKASIIEREAKLDNERKKIAGVIENRLKKDMLLQIDATVIYAMTDGRYDVMRVLYEDLETDSPYNTYKYKGLPTGPISNPGAKSIEAALNPEAHSYLYYRTDNKKNDGSHIFTESFNEHKTANK